MLVVVEDRDVHHRGQPLLDLEALRRADVFEVDAAEGWFECLDDPHHVVRIGGVDLDVEHVDVREPLEQQGLALHHRLAGQWPDIAQAENGGAVTDHGNEIPAGGVAKRLQRVLLDVQHRDGDAWGVRQGKVVLGGARLGDRDRDLPGPAGGVVVAGVVSQHGFPRPIIEVHSAYAGAPYLCTAPL